MMDLDELYDLLIEQSMATEEEINLVTNIMGWNLEAFEGILYSRTGLQSFDQLYEELEIDAD